MGNKLFGTAAVHYKEGYIANPRKQLYHRKAVFFLGGGLLGTTKTYREGYIASPGKAALQPESRLDENTWYYSRKKKEKGVAVLKRLISAVHATNRDLVFQGETVVPSKWTTPPRLNWSACLVPGCHPDLNVFGTIIALHPILLQTDPVSRERPFSTGDRIGFFPSLSLSSRWSGGYPGILLPLFLELDSHRRPW